MKENNEKENKELKTTDIAEQIRQQEENRVRGRSNISLENALFLMFRLHRMSGIGNVSMRRLIQFIEEYAGGSIMKSPERLLTRLFDLTEEQLMTILGTREKNSFLAGRTEYARQQSERAYYEMVQKGIGFYPIFHPEYPKELLQIDDPPLALYVKGRLPEPGKRKIGVIGARICSEYGRYMAREFGFGLAEYGIDIISGLALGVDGISQKAALDAGGSTYAVLGSGVDVCYPEENREIYDRISATGGILSEFTPGTQPKPGHFPMRNRIISALSHAVLVIEARKKSGSLITADLALEQGKDVFAVPGRATDCLSDGCNALLLQGAGIAVTPAQIVEELWGRQDTLQIEPQKEEEEDLPDLTKRILEKVDITPKTIQQIYDELIADCDKIATNEDNFLQIQQVTQELVMLSIRQIVHQIDGEYFCRAQF